MGCRVLAKCLQLELFNSITDGHLLSSADSLPCAISFIRLMAVLPSVQLLSWSSARLLALLLNALSGLFQHLERDKNATIGMGRGKVGTDWDTLLGLRLIQESLLTIDRQLQGRGFHPAIFGAIRNLSFHSDLLLKEKIEKARGNGRDPPTEMFGKLAPLFVVRARMEFAKHKLIDEALRWTDKEQRGEGDKRTGGGQQWLREEAPGLSCLLSFMHSKCEISRKCAEYLTAQGKIGTALTEQMFFLQLVHEQSISKCSPQLTRDNSSFNLAFKNGVHPNSTTFLISEKCANMLDELNAWTIQKNRKRLARANVGTLTLLTEQTLLCARNGFVQFASPQLLVTLLSWQHPKLGCWTAQKPDLMNNFGIRNAIELERSRGMPIKERRTDGKAAEETSSRQHGLEQLFCTSCLLLTHNLSSDFCLAHLSSVAGMAISSVYLRLLLDPGPWPEHSLAEQMIQLDGVLAEDRFRQFPYLEWVRDSFIAGIEPAVAGLRLLRPPSSNWSPDLIALVFLLLFIIIIFVLFVHFFGSVEDHPSIGKRTGALRKKMYPYAFKKL